MHDTPSLEPHAHRAHGPAALLAGLVALCVGALAGALVPPPDAPDAVVYPLVGTEWRMLAVVPSHHRSPTAGPPLSLGPPPAPVVSVAAGLPPGPSGDAHAEHSRHRAAEYASALLGRRVDPPPLGGLHGPSGTLVLALASVQAATGESWSPVPLAATGDLANGWVRPVGSVPDKVHAAQVTGAAVVFVPDDPSSAVLPAAASRHVPRMRDAGREWARRDHPFTTVAVTHVADVLWFLCGAHPGPVCRWAGLADPLGD